MASPKSVEVCFTWTGCFPLHIPSQKLDAADPGQDLTARLTLKTDRPRVVIGADLCSVLSQRRLWIRWCGSFEI